MNHPLRVTSILAIAVLCAAAGAEPAVFKPPLHPPEASRALESAASAESEGPVEVVEARRDAWLVETKRTLGESADGSWIGSGVAEVAAVPGPAWGPARIAALRRAEREARASFVERNGVEVTASTFEHLFEDRPDLKSLLDPDPSGEGDRLARIEAKLGQLEEQDLARALELAGVTAEELASLSGGERRKVLEETLRTRIVTRAVTRMAGLRVIQSFEGRVGDRFAVCVLVRWSEEYAKIAEVLRTGKGTIAPAAAGRPVEAWIPKDDSLLLHNWGVRVVPGPAGEPLVLVFSQSPIIAGANDTPRLRETRRRTAFSLARTGALGTLTLFVDCATASEQWVEHGDGIEQSLTLFPDGLSVLEPGSSALSQSLTKTIEDRGAAVIYGGTFVRSWTAEHPDTGTPFCGVVYAWSPTRARLALGSAEGGASGAKGTPGKASGYPVDF